MMLLAVFFDISLLFHNQGGHSWYRIFKKSTSNIVIYSVLSVLVADAAVIWHLC